MEEKKITIRVPETLHLQVKRRMLDDFGGDNFQRLLVGALESFVSGAGSAVAGSNESKAALSKKEQMQVEDFLRFLRTGEKTDVHTVLSLIARFSMVEQKGHESVQERKVDRR